LTSIIEIREAIKIKELTGSYFTNFNMVVQVSFLKFRTLWYSKYLNTLKNTPLHLNSSLC